MDNNKNKAARKVRELTSHLEEEDLWDLEDSWDEDDETESTDSDAAYKPKEEEESEAEEAEEPSADEAKEEELEKEETVDPVDTKQETADLFENLDDQSEEDIEIEEIPEEEAKEETQGEDSGDDEPEEPATEKDSTPEDEPQEVAEETEENPEKVASEKSTFDDPSSTQEEAAKQAALNLIKKAGLSTMEKIALGAVAAMFLGLAIWGYSFLREKNNLGQGEAKLELPIKGKYSTISGFTTFWKTPEDTTGIKIGVQVIPVASITLSDDSSGSGTFRIYFRNADKESVGDPITLSFSNGKFTNGEKSIQIAATDGFYQEGDFNAYVLDRALAWRVQVLEAANSNASGSDFEEILDTIVKPVRQ